jgi:hypothetical protein
MQTINRQKAELDTLLEAAATKDLNLASLEVNYILSRRNL